MGRVKAVPRDVVKVAPKGVSNVKKVFNDDDDDNSDEKVEDAKNVSTKGMKEVVVDVPTGVGIAKRVSKKGKKAVVEEESTETGIATKALKKGKKAVVADVPTDGDIKKKVSTNGKKTDDEEPPEEVSANNNDEIRRLREWHESIVTGNSRIKKRNTKKEPSTKVDPSTALDLSVLEAYTQYNGTSMNNEMSDDDDSSPEPNNNKKIDKSARSKQVGNLQVTYIDPKLHDPFAIYHMSSSAIEFTKSIKEQQPRVTYAVFRAQKNGGPSKVFKR